MKIEIDRFTIRCEDDPLFILTCNNLRHNLFHFYGEQYYF
jgi:hypothetical protein